MKRLLFLFILICLIACKFQEKQIEKQIVHPTFYINNITQTKNCFCAKDTTGIYDCDTTQLRDGFLHYQHTCDSIWLTYEHKGKFVLESIPNDEYDGFLNRTYYQFCREYDQFLLFRYNCPATGACEHVLIDKNTGKIKEELGELIRDRTKDAYLDFILYFAKNNYIIVHFVDEDKRFIVPMSDDIQHFSQPPEHEFENVKRKGDIIYLTYCAKNGQQKVMKLKYR